MSFAGEFLGLPGLRGYWPMSAFDSSGNAIDQSGNARTLTYNGNPTYNFTTEGGPYLDCDGTGDYLSRADEAGLDILGTESYVASAVQGLTLGGWFWADSFTSSPCLINKYLATGNQKSYLILFTTGGAVQFVVSGTGANDFVIATTTTATTGAWFFSVGRYIPSTSITAYINAATPISNTTSIPASIFNSSASLNLGRMSDTASNVLDGRLSNVFLCTMALSDTAIDNIYQNTKAYYGL